MHWHPHPHLTHPHHYPTHPAAFWLILIGGLLTVAGLVLTVLSILAIRRAVEREKGRLTITAWDAPAPGSPRPPAWHTADDVPLEQRMRLVEDRIGQLQWEWKEDL